MPPTESVSDLYLRGLAKGLSGLSPIEREVLLVQDFLVEVEMGGLTGYLYNKLPDVERIADTAAAMRKFGPTALAKPLGEVARAFRDYRAPDDALTWEETRAQYLQPRRFATLAAQVEGAISAGYEAAASRFEALTRRPTVRHRMQKPAPRPSRTGPSKRRARRSRRSQSRSRRS